MDIIDRILSIFRKNKKQTPGASDDTASYFNHRQMETLASANSASEGWVQHSKEDGPGGNSSGQAWTQHSKEDEWAMNQKTAIQTAGLDIPTKGGPITGGAAPAYSIPVKGGPMEAIEATVSSPYDQEVQTANRLTGDLGEHRQGGYQDVSPSELKPIEGYPGQFTNGGGKGGHDPVTGNSHGTYPVFDAEGKFLGENATTVISGVSTNSGYSYGTPVQKNVDLSVNIMNQEQALKSAGLDFPIKGGPEDITGTSQSATPVNGNNEPMSAGETGKGGTINGVDTAVPAGMVGTPDGLIMNQETALRSAGLDMSGLAETPSKGGPSEASAPSSPPTPGYDPAQQYNVENVHIPSIQEVQADAAAYTPTQPQSLSQQRLEQGRMQRLDPEGTMSGGANFDIAGPTENPVDSFGGASGDHQAV